MCYCLKLNRTEQIKNKLAHKISQNVLNYCLFIDFAVNHLKISLCLVTKIKVKNYIHIFLGCVMHMHGKHCPAMQCFTELSVCVHRKKWAAFSSVKKPQLF